ncbi:MAG: plasmid recombination protein [Firmicutes bacterium]|nr:plasmid recombination protein [Bacillota bacterium]
MAHRTVVRNEAYQAGGFNTRERHNERKNENYFNGDIDPAREDLNIHFRQNFRADGLPETYQETFDRLLDEGKIVRHGTKPDAKIFCEMVFDVNTNYFEESGGYDYAKSFFSEAYRLAVKEAGSEDYILSAVMHADERNKALSEQYGRDVYHYHLHVVYVPVVEKKLYFKKNNKDPELAGKLKEVIPQISQANKWPMRVPVERDGKTIMVNSYSLLQDRFYEHMRAAGFDGFERGERGSTAEHLDVLDYKIKQDTARVAALNEAIEDREKESDALDKAAERKVKQIAALDKKIEDRNFVQANIKEINKVGSTKNVFGQIVVTPEDLDYVKAFAREGAASRVKLSGLVQKIKRVEADRDAWKFKYERLMNRAALFLDAMKRAPNRVMEFLKTVLREPPELQEPERRQPERTKNRSREMER